MLRIFSTVLFFFLLLSTDFPMARTIETGFLNRYVKVGKTIYRYQVYLPANFDNTKKWPVILFLHGSGERGEDGLLQTEVGLASAIRKNAARFKSIVIFPQCRVDSHWTYAASQKVAIKALDSSLKEFNGDPERVYLTGLSMGGSGVWYTAANYPGKFAAVVPICGWVVPPAGLTSVTDLPQEVKEIAEAVDPYMAMAERVKETPFWIYHSKDDNVISVEESRRMYEALKALGSKARYTEYEDQGHSAWDKAYSEPELVEWLLKQRLPKKTVISKPKP